ncbi:MAG: pyridoxamine 5'-phosphate oxidase family protein [Candidatus Thorarchaeota archaeon]
MEKIPSDIRDEIWSNLNEYRIVHFATSVDNQPHVRPLTMVPLDDELWILTGTKDAKMQELNLNPNVQVSMEVEKDEHTGSVRFTGKVVVIKDLETKKGIAGRVDYFKEYWDTSEDPNFTLLKMDFYELEYMRPGEITAKKYSLK